MIRSHKISALQPSRSFAFLRLTLAVAVGVLVFAGAASAQSRLAVQHAFASQWAINPGSALIQATDGNFYGTTSGGGTTGDGTVFTITAGGALTILHAFNYSTDGSSPMAALIQ